MAQNTMSKHHLTSFAELANELDWDKFAIATRSGRMLTNQDFDLIAIGRPNQEKERWDMQILDTRYNSTEDLVYALVVGGKLLKIGKSITTMQKRVQSYHCGKNAYRAKSNSTNSATNWYILQSVLAINMPVYIYAMYIAPSQGEFMGWTYTNRVSKEVEGIIIGAFADTYGFMPIGNRQH